METTTMHLDLKWATRQRLQYIEVQAFYCGVVSRSDVARAFGMSDPAATKDLKLYNTLAPGNLNYSQAVFGFVPSADFVPVFSSLDPAEVLPAIAANLAETGGPYGDTPIYGLPVESLPLPARLPDRQILAQITRAIRGRRKLQAVYRSLSGQEEDGTLRILEPHTLVNTGLRWHVRAYNEDHYDFRDFVLSRFSFAKCQDEAAESGAEYDEDWVEPLLLKLGPHKHLDEKRRENLKLDYGIQQGSMQDGVIEISVRRALAGYLLQRLGVDTTQNLRQNPQSFQLMLLNRDDIEPFAAWALD